MVVVATRASYGNTSRIPSVVAREPFSRVNGLVVLVVVGCSRASRSGLRPDRDMGLMNAIGLQPRHPAPSVTSQGTQTPIVQLQNAETQTERELPEPGGSQPGPRNCCTRHCPASCLRRGALTQDRPVSPDAPPGTPATSQAAAGQQAASQTSVQTEAPAEDGAPPGSAGTAPPGSRWPGTSLAPV